MERVVVSGLFVRGGVDLGDEPQRRSPDLRGRHRGRGFGTRGGGEGIASVADGAAQRCGVEVLGIEPGGHSADFTAVPRPPVAGGVSVVRVVEGW